MDYVTIAILILGLFALGFFIKATIQTILNNNLNKSIESKLNEMFPKIMQNANEQLITMANQRLGAESKNMLTDVANKKESIEQLVKRLQEEVNNHNSKLETAERDRIGSFNKIVESLSKHQEELQRQREQTEKLTDTANKLKNVLSNNQKRGQFGEQVADDLLKLNGFVIHEDYEKQQFVAENRPDFTVYLPDKTKINVDCKFPLANLQAMVDTEDMSAKDKYRKDFESDIKKKIKDVASRDYINPEENTVDFAIIFIPNEMIFSYIYENMSDTWKSAMENRIIFAGPFNFTAILRMIRQAYTNFKYQKDVVRIIGIIKQFEEEFNKYNKEFEKIGDKIESLSSQYQVVNSTRTNKLLRTIDKVKMNEEARQESLLPNEAPALK